MVEHQKFFYFEENVKRIYKAISLCVGTDFTLGNINS